MPQFTGAQLVAVADVYEPHLDRAATMAGPGTAKFHNYGELLEENRMSSPALPPVPITPIRIRSLAPNTLDGARATKLVKCVSLIKPRRVFPTSWVIIVRLPLSASRPPAKPQRFAVRALSRYRFRCLHKTKDAHVL